MPPASLAHFKNRATSADTSSSDDQSPSPKRARDSPLLLVAERSVMAMTPPYDEKKVATSNVAPDHEKKSLRGKAPMDLDNACCRGNFDLSDLETLRCNICHNALFLPLYQCKNGHTACPTCWSNFERARRCCHSCKELTWNIRCLGLEKILEQLTVRCSNSVYGCNEFPRFLKRKEHEEGFCRHRPLKCPVDDCRYEGPKPALLQHFDKVHHMQAVQIDRVSRIANFTMKSTEKYKLLQTDQDLYIVYHETVNGSLLGDIFYCASFGPYKWGYMLAVELKSEARYHILRATIPEIKVLETWKQRRDYLILMNGVQVEPRSNCEFTIQVEIFGPFL
ncbi:hypothetical protein M758_2G168000 [Ceratodon purpureus]|nr:hypothetical protein M758_2G167700 [Ceratodon purpureus]KAG0627015.1 hypothetical protein M758_2G168000 [Ceratodon purpureus]